MYVFNLINFKKLCSLLFSNSLRSIENNLIYFLHNRVWVRNKGHTICSQCSHLISCDESCCNIKFTGFHMNIRLAHLKLFNAWSYDGSNPREKNLRPPTPNWSDDYPRTVDSMFFPYFPITTNDVTQVKGALALC